MWRLVVFKYIANGRRLPEWLDFNHKKKLRKMYNNLTTNNSNESESSAFLVGATTGNTCPFEVGEIVVFESWLRFEIYISRVMQIHVDYWGNGGMPKMTKATLQQKQQWYENGEYEMVIGSLHCR